GKVQDRERRHARTARSASRRSSTAPAPVPHVPERSSPPARDRRRRRARAPRRAPRGACLPPRTSLHLPASGRRAGRAAPPRQRPRARAPRRAPRGACVTPLTILHLAANRWWTGSADPTIQLAAGLRARGHRVLLGVIPGDRFEVKAREAGLELVEELRLGSG